jgi:hypothetical protein
MESAKNKVIDFVNHPPSWKKAFSLFLPLKLYQPELDLRRLIRVNLSSVERYLDRELLDQIVIATRPSDLVVTHRAIKEANLSIPVRVIRETDVVPSLGKLGGLGWFRQQVLKLFAWRVITSPYVILMDDDVLMTRPTGISELMLDGKLVMSHLHADGFSQYLDSSCSLLAYERESIAPDQRVMNVTPEIMVTKELRAVIHDLVHLWELRNEEHAAEFLLRISRDYADPFPKTPFQQLLRKISQRISRSNPSTWNEKSKIFQYWSEYTLYWVYLLKSNRTGYYYDYNSDKHARQLNDPGVWFEKQAAELGIDAWMHRTFAPDHQHCFAMYSARIENVDRKLLYQRIEAHIQKQPTCT